MYEFFTQPGSKSAMSDQGEAAAHVRCTPMATELVRHGNPPLRAKSRPSVGGQDEWKVEPHGRLHDELSPILRSPRRAIV